MQELKKLGLCIVAFGTIAFAGDIIEGKEISQDSPARQVESNGQEVQAVASFGGTENPFDGYNVIGKFTIEYGGSHTLWVNPDTVIYLNGNMIYSSKNYEMDTVTFTQQGDYVVLERNW